MRFLYFVMLISAVGLVSGLNVSSCGNLSSANTAYVLTANLTFSGNSNEACLNVNASNVTLDCNGFWLFGNMSAFSYGVNLTNESTRVQGCTFKNFTGAMTLLAANHSVITNNTFLNNTHGVRGDPNPVNPDSFNVTISFNSFNNSAPIPEVVGSSITLNGGDFSILNISYNNFTYDNHNAIRVTDNVTVLGNYFANVSKAAVHITRGNWVNVTSNTVVNSSFVAVGGGHPAASIFAFSSEHVNVSYNTIVNGVNGIYLTWDLLNPLSGSNNSFAGFNNVSFVNASGVSALNAVGINVSNNTIYNVSNSSASEVYGIYLLNLTNSNASYNSVSNISSNQSSPSIFLSGLINASVVGNILSGSSTGINASSTSFASLLLNRLSSLSTYGFWFYGATASNASHNFLSGAGTRAVYLTANSSAVFYNTSLNQSGVAFGDTASNASVWWAVSVLVRDFNGVAIQGASVSLSNSTTSLVNALSDSSGLAINNLLVQEYFQNGSQAYGTNVTDAKPFSVSANAAGYSPVSASVNFTSSSTYTASLIPLGGGNNPTATPTPTPSPASSLTPSSTPTPTLVSSPSPTILSNATPTASPIPIASPRLINSSSQVSRNLQNQYSIVLNQVLQRINALEENDNTLEARRLVALAQEAASKGDYSAAMQYLNKAQSLLTDRTVILEERNSGVFYLAAVVLVALGLVFVFMRKRS